MKLYLNSENSDIYSIPVTGTHRKKGLKDFVQKTLLSLHPGFDDDTEFDYIRKGDAITAVVADSLWLTEQRIRNRNIAFVLTVDNKRYRVFKNRKKKLFVLPLVLVAGTMIVLFGLCRITANRAGEVSVISEEEAQQLPAVTDSISFLCQHASKLRDNRGSLTAVTYNCGIYQELIFSAGEITPQVAINTLGMPAQIDAVSYVDNTPFFTASVNEYGISLYPASVPVSRIHAEIDSALHSISGIEMQSAQLNRNGSVSFDFSLTGKSIDPFVSAVSALTDKHLFFTNASFINSGNGLLSVSLTAIALDETQPITTDKTALKELSQLFDLTVPPVIKPVETKVPEIKESTLPRGATKIGETIHGTVKTIYIRLADGKIETRTEKVD